jgi:hypothetical protein
MPKRPGRHNPDSTKVGGNSISNSRTANRAPLRAPQSVNTLLNRLSQSPLARVANQRQAQEDWRNWLKNRLSAALDTHITGAVERDSTLTVFADSAAWSARLRFALAEIEAQIYERSAEIQKIVVRVMPRR